MTKQSFWEQAKAALDYYGAKMTEATEKFENFFGVEDLSKCKVKDDPYVLDKKFLSVAREIAARIPFGQTILNQMSDPFKENLHTTGRPAQEANNSTRPFERTLGGKIPG